MYATVQLKKKQNNMSSSDPCPKGVRSRSSFSRAYMLAHPGTSEEVVRHKFEKAFQIMFGKNIRRSRQPTTPSQHPTASNTKSTKKKKSSKDMSIDGETKDNTEADFERVAPKKKRPTKKTLPTRNTAKTASSKHDDDEEVEEQREGRRLDYASPMLRQRAVTPVEEDETEEDIHVSRLDTNPLRRNDATRFEYVPPPMRQDAEYESVEYMLPPPIRQDAKPVEYVPPPFMHPDDEPFEYARPMRQDVAYSHNEEEDGFVIVSRRADTGVGRSDSTHVPDLLSERYDRHDFVDISHIAKCQLPEWMDAVVRKLPINHDPKPPVRMIPKTSEYIFGVCRSQFDHTVRVLQAIEGHKQLEHFYPRYMSFHLLNNMFDTVKSVRGLQHFVHFVKGHQYCVALHMVYSSNQNHTRLFVKDPKTKKIYIVDPTGESQVVDDETLLIDTLKEIVLDDGSRKLDIDAIETRTSRKDQNYEGFACTADALTRGLFVAYSIFKNPATSPLDYLDKPIPCIFAMFVSELFHRAGIITPERHKKSHRQVIKKLIKDRGAGGHL